MGRWSWTPAARRRRNVPSTRSESRGPRRARRECFRTSGPSTSRGTGGPRRPRRRRANRPRARPRRRRRDRGRRPRGPPAGGGRRHPRPAARGPRGSRVFPSRSPPRERPRFPGRDPPRDRSPRRGRKARGRETAPTRRRPRDTATTNMTATAIVTFCLPVTGQPPSSAGSPEPAPGLAMERIPGRRGCTPAPADRRPACCPSSVSPPPLPHPSAAPGPGRDPRPRRVPACVIPCRPERAADQRPRRGGSHLPRPCVTRGRLRSLGPGPPDLHRGRHPGIAP